METSRNLPIVGLVTLIVLSSSVAFCQSSNYAGWEIISSDLSGGNLVMAAGETRTIKFNITVLRSLDPKGGANDWIPVDFKFNLGRMPRNASICGPCTSISATQTIKSTDFMVGKGTVTKQYSVTITAQAGTSETGQSLRDGDKIFFETTSGVYPWSPSKDYSVIVTSTAPPTPKNLALTNGSSCSTSLTWSKPSGVVSGYNVYKDGVVIQSVSSTTTNISNLNPNTNYLFSISAYNQFGESSRSVAVSYISPGDIAGASLNSPININLVPQSYFYDSKSNILSNCFKNNFIGSESNGFNGQPSDDIYYKFTSSYYGRLQISTCGSVLTDTYIHLLKYDGTWIASNDDSGPICAGNTASMIKDIEPGTYYIVLEGKGTNSGVINLSMILDTRYVAGSDWYIPIDVGVLNRCSRYSESKQYINPTFHDFYGGSGDDVIYKFSLSVGANITIASCNDIHDFRVHLFNDSNLLIQDGHPDACLIKRYLNAGNYSVIVEGEPDSYPFAYNLPFAIWTSDCTSSSGGRVSLSTSSDGHSENSEEKQGDIITLFPVPAKNSITIVPKLTSSYSISIVDMLGNTVKSWHNLANSHILDIEELRDGIYLLRVTSLEYSTTKKIEVRNN